MYFERLGLEMLWPPMSLTLWHEGVRRGQGGDGQGQKVVLATHHEAVADDVHSALCYVCSVPHPDGGPHITPEGQSLLEEVHSKSLWYEEGQMSRGV